ncbi:MAG TPA: hypothetical protein PKE65_01770 [Rhizobiaceae bacterium]|nr:hypothetical protein [Rhizobiaceae bacterium]
MARALILFAALVSAVCNTAAQCGESLPAGVDPATGFRMERYRAPVPDVLPGGAVVHGDDVARLAADDAVVLIDVYPPKGAGPDPLDGTWRNSEARENIAGSIWLPEVGRGYLEPELEAYFRRNLQRIASENPGEPLLFYCTADCWQAWNAARRAILWGYGRVLWYPEGTDGWRDEGRALAPAEPVNFLGSDNE